MSDKKLSSETVRFLNHIEREIANRTKKTNAEVSRLKYELDQANSDNRQLARQIAATNQTFDEMATSFSEMELKYKLAIQAITHLLPKIRVDIWRGNRSTPRYFKSEKWWPRETGNLDVEFVSEMTDAEKIEAIDFYGTTELPFMAKPSMRDEISHFEDAKSLWYQYAALPENDRNKQSFPQFLGVCRAEYKQQIKNEIVEKEMKITQH